jgi:Flp pilus assembly protein TadG
MKPLRTDTRGSVLIITVFGIFLLMAIAGAATDLGRWALVELQVQQAVDAAALAAAAMPDKKSDGTDVTDADRDATVMRYFAMNYPANFMGVSIPPSAAKPTYSATDLTIAVSGVQMPTKFMQFVGLSTLPVHASSGLKITTSSTGTSYDIMLVLDNSASMASDDVGSVNSLESTAPGTVLNTAISYCQAHSPFVSANPAFCNLTSASSKTDPFTTGLVGKSRLNALRYAANTFATHLLSKNSHSLVAAVNWSDGVIGTLPVTSDLPTITNYLNGMYAWGGTNSYEGFQRAQTLASGFDPSHVHVVIYITDGINTIADSASEHVTSGVVSDRYGCNGRTLCTETNRLTNDVCTAFKNSNTRIYAIAFGTEISDPAAQAFMKACASADATGKPLFFIAPDAQTLSTAFNGILTSIRKIKIVR